MQIIRICKYFAIKIYKNDEAAEFSILRLYAMFLRIT